MLVSPLFSIRRAFAACSPAAYLVGYRIRHSITQKSDIVMIKRFSLSVLFGAILPGLAVAQTVTVSTPAELAPAYAQLSASAGGGTIALARDFPARGEISLSGGGNNPVHITSADPSNPVRVSRIAIDQADNIRISRLRVNGDGIERPDWHRDLDVTNASRISIEGVAFTSDADSFFDPANPRASNGGEMGLIRWSEGVTVAGSRIAGYLHGLQFFETTGITVSGNEITAIIGDGIRLAGVQNVLIENNHLHDFYATTNEYTHADFIQMWSHNAEIVSRNITVRGNVMDAGNGNSAQGIWMGNEAAGAGYVYRDITITDNLIYTGNPNGIGIGTADGVRIENNTILWNPQATTLYEGVPRSWPPRIRLADNIRNAEVHDNITFDVARWNLNGPPLGDVRMSGNVTVSYTPGQANYVGNHFAGVAGGGDIGPAGWRLRDGSPWIGAGSSTTLR
jgi:hypothetical protein